MTRVVVVGVVLLLGTLTASGAGATSAPVILVEPGASIGKVRLGMTIAQARRAVGRAFVLDDVDRVPNDTLRLLQYRTRDERWTVAFFGSPGLERVARVVSSAPRTRTKSGIGVGTPVLTLKGRLRGHRPVCIQRRPFFNYVEHAMQVVSCAVRRSGATTAFFGGIPICAAARVIRFQGCTNLRVKVGSVMIESDDLRRYKLSWWYPVTIIPAPPITVQG
jgi:hypothetical protein